METTLFRVSGTEVDPGSIDQHLLPEDFDIRKVFKVHSQRSAEQPVITDAIDGQDVVLLKIASGPALVLHPQDARDLLRSDGIEQSDGAAMPITVSSRLPWTQAGSSKRGGNNLATGVVLDWFSILRRKASDTAAATIAQSIAEQVDAKVCDGLYRLNREVLPTDLCESGAPIGQLSEEYGNVPMLVFIHGTFVNTASTFGNLWLEHRDEVNALFDHYDNRVFALDHATMGKSPIANAIVLADSLPEHAVLHLVTHSRGGLVADVMVRACAEREPGNADKYFNDAKFAQQREEMAELRAILRKKAVTVQRVVRVACPARGTLLASSRLDAYLSVLQWLMRLANLDIAPELLNLLYEVARQRTEPETLPGIQAMMPDSPIVRWLNAPLDGVNSELFVVAGDSGGDSVLSWIKTLAADAFFWTDNDLVVQTRSMYGGVPRNANAAKPRFHLAKGSEVSHFTYFSNMATVNAMLDVLIRGRGDLWATIGPLSWSGGDAGGVRSATSVRTKNAVSNERPCVIVVPDMFGSVLANKAGQRLWLTSESLRQFDRLAFNGVMNDVVPVGLLDAYYGALCVRMQESHEVVEFAYDWRQPIDVEASRLAKKILEVAELRVHSGQPIRIVAHGMGGLLVRAVQMKAPDAWRALLAAEGSRIILLGVPNHGSWLPLQVLTGDESFGNLLNSAGPLFDDGAIRKFLACMPGFIQLQAGMTTQSLANEAGWRELEDIDKRARLSASKWHRRGDEWGIPPQPLLTQAKDWWESMARSLPELLRDVGKIVVVLGQARRTVSGFTRENGSVYFTTTNDADRYVTLDSALLDGASTWRVNAPHDALTSLTSAFPGLIELLAQGNTTLLPKLDMQARRQLAPNAGALAPNGRENRPIRHFDDAMPAPEVSGLFFTPQDDDDSGRTDNCLVVNVHHGDLRFMKMPLLVGHYQSLSLSGSEGVVDALVNQRMSKALRAGVYPGRVGSFQIFENGRHSKAGRRKQRFISRPKAAIVVGLGEEGKLNTQHLSYTIRIGVLAFSERLAESLDVVGPFELAATLVGSGGTGISVSNSALALVQGISDANVRLREVGWPTVGTLSIVELYLDRATDAWRVLKMQAETNPDRLSVEGFLIPGDGNLRRPLETSYRGAAYDFISAVKLEGSSDSNPIISFSLDTKRARTEVRAQRAQGTLVRDLVERASNTLPADRQIGRTLFNLLIPVEIEPFLTGSTDMLMELDAATSALPWEMLDTDPQVPAAGAATARPWAVRSKVIRKLRVHEYREQVVDASAEDNVLIIGAPLTDDTLGKLPDAEREAASIAKVAEASLGANSGRITLLKQQNARKIINELFARNYRIVHIAGHGCATDVCDGGGGVVLSGQNTYLGSNEIVAMRVTPELVFLNCCHLAQGGQQSQYDRVAFAAGVAGALINIGVRCVIAAGWAIEDGAAEQFAVTFYRELFAGKRFIDAVGSARQAAWEFQPDGNTWAAYQCYGDPDWSWKNSTGAVVPSAAEEYAGVASPTTLILVLQTIATEALYAPTENPQRNRERLNHLKLRFAEWTSRGDVAQEFGAAYAALPDREAAMEWLFIAMNASDGTSSLKAIELYAEQLSQPGSACAELQKAISYFEKLLNELTPTLARQSLLGNAYKRLSMLCANVGVAGRHLNDARQKFDSASLLSGGQSMNRYYPMRASLACQLRSLLITNTPIPQDWKEREIAAVDKEIVEAVDRDPKFWSIVAQSELDILRGIVKRRLALNVDDISASLSDLYKRIRTKRYWVYVEDEARFLLQPYGAVAQEAAERQAATTLCNLIKQYSTHVQSGN